MRPPAIISIRIKGNSMKGTFNDGELLDVKLKMDVDETDLCPGIVIVIKKPPFFDGGKDFKEIVKSDSSDGLSKQGRLIIHRLVAISRYRDKLYVWEKGDYDCIPILRPFEDVKGIISGFKREREDGLSVSNGFFVINARAWAMKNKGLILFCRMVGKCYLPLKSKKKD